MKKVLLDFKGYTVAQKIVFGDKVIEKLTGNATVTTADPTIADLKTVNDDLRLKYIAASNGDSQKIEERNTAEALWIDLFVREAFTVQAACKGDADKILTTGFNASKTPVASPENLIAPIKVVIVNKDLQDALKVKTSKVDGARWYEYEVGVVFDVTEHNPNGTIKKLETIISNNQSIFLSNLQAGQMYVARVRGCNSKTKGGWSYVVSQKCN